MPSSLWGVAFYVFALFPGVAFAFAREGHQPTGRRSALRETATIVLVSTICDGALALVIAILAAAVKPFRRELVGVLRGRLDWVEANLLWSVAAVLVALLATTLLGYLLGSKWAWGAGLKRLWRSDIPRDTSAWAALFDVGDKAVEVHLGLQLKSGSWLSGTLFRYDNDPDQHPHRALTLTEVVTRDALGALTPLADYLIVEAGEIEYMQITLTEQSSLTGESTASKTG